MSVPKYNVCIGKPIPGGKQMFTQIGVAFVNDKTGSISFNTDITVILSPSDRVFIFHKKDKQEKEADDSVF